MRILALVLALVMLAAPAYAASLTSVSDGNINDAGVWNTGTAPTASDLLIIGHAVSVPYDYTFGGNMLVNSGGELIVQAGATLTFDGQPTGTNVSVASGGTVTNYGRMVVGSGAVGTSSHAMIVANTGSTIRMRGASVGTGTIRSIPLETATTDSTRLTVTFDTPIPPDASHVRVTSGRFAGAIWPIAYTTADDERTGALYGPLVQGYDSAALIVNASSGADSIVVVDSTVQPDTRYAMGATILQELDGSTATQYLGTIERVFPNSIAGATAFYVTTDDALVPASGGTTNYILTRGVFPGQKVEFCRMAEVVGALSLPAFDDQNYYWPTPGPWSSRGTSDGTDECVYLTINGSLDLDYASFRWLGKASGGALNGTTAGSGTWTIDDTVFIENHGQYLVNFNFHTTDSFTMRDSFAWRILGPNNGDFAHWVAFSDNGAGGTCTISGSGLWDSKDDFVYVNEGGTVSMTDCFSVNSLSGNLLDWGNGAGSLVLTDNQGWAVGENPVQLDDGDFTDVTIARNRFTNCGIAWGFDTVDGHDGSGGSTANTKSWGIIGSAVTVSSSITVEADTVTWANFDIGSAAITYANSPDTLTIRNFVMENYGNYTTAIPDSSLWTPASMSPGGWEFNMSQGGVIFDGCKFINPWRRGQTTALSGLNARTNFAVQLRGAGASSQDAFIRNSLFVGTKTHVTDATTTDAGSRYWVYSEDSNLNVFGMSSSHFEDVENPMYIHQTNMDIASVHDIVGVTFVFAGEDADEGIRVRNGKTTGTPGMNFVRCAFVKKDATSTHVVRVLDAGTGADPYTYFTDCIFENLGGTDVALVRFDDTTLSGRTTGDGNTFDVGTLPLDLVSVSGVGNYTTIAALEAGIAWTNTVDADVTSRYTVTIYAW